MINANELMIGNKIIFIICSHEDVSLDEKKIITVTAEDFTYINNNPSLYEPILITEESLNELGFKQEENPNFFKKGNLSISIGTCFYVLSNLGNGEAMIKTNKIKYIHQAQNLDSLINITLKS